MSAFARFVHMGGYAFYVWTAYGVALVVLVGNVVAALLAGRDVRRRLAREARFADRGTDGD